MKYYFYKGLLGFFLGWISFVSATNAYTHEKQDLPNFTAADYQWLAHKIFKNEANLNSRYLTHWSAGEAFPSLGIGHFIWLPKPAKQGKVVFEETFPKMVAFVGARVAPPVWLQTLEPFEVPWENKAKFDQA